MNYDFKNLEYAVSTVKRNPQSNMNLNKLKIELNKFFKDSKCLEVIYTKNTDSLFFGMCVIPKLDGDIINKILATDEKIRLNQYYLEIDSKLFELNLTTQELTAILLHEVGHLVNDCKPVEEVRSTIDEYLVYNNDHLVLSDAAQYRDIIAFGIKDTIRKMNSLFEKDDEEILADRFVYECGYGMHLENALVKIVRNSRGLNKGVKNKLIVLQWTLGLYKDVKHRRIPALHTLNKAKKVEGSVLKKRNINLVLKRLEEIDDDFMIGESVNIFKKMYRSFKFKGIKMFEEDFYELALEGKNCDDTDEVLSIIRRINTRISIINDYLATEELDDKERQRWINLLDKYERLREDLSKKKTSEKYIGLFVQTPVVKSRYDY